MSNVAAGKPCRAGGSGHRRREDQCRGPGAAAAANAAEDRQSRAAAGSRRALPQFNEVEPAPVPPMPQFKIQPETKTEQQKPETKQKQNSQDFAALLEQAHRAGQARANAKAGPRTSRASAPATR